jgi:hypothetical protein
VRLERAGIAVEYTAAHRADHNIEARGFRVIEGDSANGCHAL